MEKEKNFSKKSGIAAFFVFWITVCYKGVAPNGAQR